MAGKLLAAGKNLESQSSPEPAKDGSSSAENSGLRQFAVQCHSEPHPVSSEITKPSDPTKTSPEKRLLDRFGEISLSADKNGAKSEGKATIAWNKLFHPACFNEKQETEKEIISLDKNIYT